MTDSGPIALQLLPLPPPPNRGTASEQTFHLARQVTTKLFTGLFSIYLFVPLGALEDVGMEHVQMHVRHLCLFFFLLGGIGRAGSP